MSLQIAIAVETHLAGRLALTEIVMIMIIMTMI